MSPAAERKPVFFEEIQPQRKSKTIVDLSVATQINNIIYGDTPPPIHLPRAEHSLARGATGLMNNASLIAEDDIDECNQSATVTINRKRNKRPRATAGS